MIRFFILFLTVIVSDSLLSQGKMPLVTDRPDMTESAVSLAPGLMQVETGFHFENDKVGEFETNYRNLNTSLIRYGLIDGLEFRFGFGYASFSFPGTTEQGFEPLSFGFKYELSRQSGILPEMAVLNTFVPDFSGSSEFRPGAWGGEFLGAAAWAFESLDLGANIGVAFEDNTRGALFPYSTAVGFSLVNSLGGFVELFGVLAESESPAHSGNLGLTFLVNPDFQLDAYYGFGLNERAVDWSAGVGLSWRFEL